MEGVPKHAVRRARNCVKEKGVKGRYGIGVSVSVRVSTCNEIRVYDDSGRERGLTELSLTVSGSTTS